MKRMSYAFPATAGMPAVAAKYENARHGSAGETVPGKPENGKLIGPKSLSNQAFGFGAGAGSSSISGGGSGRRKQRIEPSRKVKAAIAAAA